jgi:hypothetical protein
MVPTIDINAGTIIALILEYAAVSEPKEELMDGYLEKSWAFFIPTRSSAGSISLVRVSSLLPFAV